MASRQHIQGKEWCATGSKTDPGDAKIALGYVDEKPPFQTENFKGNRVEEMVGHIEEYGMPVWDALTTYNINSYCLGSDGIIYKSLQNANLNNAITTPSWWEQAFTRPYIKITDVKAAGGGGGAFTPATTRITRVLNTVDVDETGGVSLSSNQITLPAGTYEFRISAPANYVDGHQARLRNTTGNFVFPAGQSFILGTSEKAFVSTTYPETQGNNTHSIVVGRFTVAASQALEVQHECETANATTAGFGNGTSLANNIYTQCEFWKVG